MALRTKNARVGFRDVRISDGGGRRMLTFRTTPAVEVSRQWSAFSTGDAEASYRHLTGDSFNGACAQHMAFVSGTGTVGLANGGLNGWGIAVRAGQTFAGRLWLKGRGEVVVALQSADGKREYASRRLTGLGAEWRCFPFELTASATDDRARFALLLDRPGSIEVDQASLMSTGADRFRGLPVRGDIGEAMVDEGLTFLRYGGTMVNAEGYRFKKMIGDRDRRPPYRGHWYRYSTNGFGIEEFVQFCEKAGFEAAFAVNIEETPEDMADMVEYLRRLEIPVEGHEIRVPSWRPDLVGMADIAEEVGRLFGYNNIPTTTFRGAATEGGYTEAMKLENRAGSLCRSLGYSEILTYSFVSPSIFDQIRLPEDSSLRNAMRIQNPLGEDASIMRTVALPSMLAILARNNAYHNDAVKLYELAKVYLPKPGQILPDEPKHLVLGTYGEHEDFFKMKGEIEAFLRGMNVPEARYTAEKHDPTFHPGRCARVSVGGVDLGCFGQIHPLVARSYGIDGEIFAAELNFTALLSLQLPEKTYTPLPKYPAVTRDIAVVCGEAVTVAALSDCIRAAGGKLLRSVELFDIYRGKGIASGSKSAAFRLTLRADDRTLTDADSDGVVSAVLAALEKELNAKLR